MDIRLDKHEPEPKSWAKGGNPSPEPRAQSPGILERAPARAATWGPSQGFERVRGFRVEVRTDHLLIIDRPGRSQGRTLSSVVCRVLFVCTCVPTRFITSGQNPRGLIHLIGPATADRLLQPCALVGDRLSPNRPSLPDLRWQIDPSLVPPTQYQYQSRPPGAREMGRCESNNARGVPSHSPRIFGYGASRPNLLDAEGFGRGRGISLYFSPSHRGRRLEGARTAIKGGGGGSGGGRTAWRSGARRVTLSRFDARSCRLEIRRV